MKYYHTILKKGKFKVILGDKSDFLAKKKLRNMREMK